MKKNLLFIIMLLTGKLLLSQVITIPSFNPPVSFSNGSSSGPGTVSDIDGDGKSDLVVFERITSVSILRNTSSAGNLSFAPTVNINCKFAANYISVADMDGDGKNDLLVAGNIPYDYLLSYVTIYRNTSTIGNISFAPAYEFLFSGTEWPTIATGDLDGDGRIDIAAQTPASVTILKNTGSPGTISLELGPELYSGSAVRSIAIADIDGDGKQDIAAANYGELNVSVFRNLSSGTISFAPRQTFATGDRPFTVIAGDINGDNKPDLILNSHYQLSLTVLTNTSIGGFIGFISSSFPTLGITAPCALSMGDVNADGKPDIVLANAGSLGGASTCNISLYINSGQIGNNQFLPAIPFYSGGISMSMIGISDLDGDGKPDIAAGAENAYYSLVFKNTTIISTTKKYVNDNSLSGDIFTTAVGNNTNTGSPSSPFATITHAMSQSSEGDTIYVDAGTFTEQVTIDKGITIIGAGQNLSSILKPAITVAPPGSFTEQGVIQTAQNINDVHISNLSITGDYTVAVTPIILQTGGSVKNCKLQNGNQGLFVRVDAATNSASKNIVVDGNNIKAEYIAVNLAGTNLSATLTNNTLEAFNAGFSTCVFAGVDFGSLANLTASSNAFNTYYTNAIMLNIANGVVSQNSFTGNGQVAINKIGGPTINATCNWYGSADAAVVIPKITSGVTYAAWLSIGTDNSTDPGFQPLPGVCTGRQNKFYVNDNSLTGDVLTSSIGNDVNSGISSAPKATLAAALTSAQPGDTIFVDAGTYATPNLNITKAVTILGSNYNVSPNTPADRLTINPLRNAEALITGSTLTIASNDVRLEGLAFNPGAKSLITIVGTGANNFTFKRNYSKATSGTLINLNGPAIPVGQIPVFGNYLVDDNRFESQSTVFTTCIAVNSLIDVTVNNNAFVTPLAFPQRMFSNSIAGNTGGGHAVNYAYTNNISYAARNEWFTSGNIASARIENNISLQGQRAYIIQTSVSVSSDIQVRNNYVETNFSDLSPVQYLRSGIALPGVVANLLIENNTLIQDPAGRTFVPAAILAQAFFPGSIPSITILRNKISFNGDYSTFVNSSVLGVSLTGSWQNINLEENEIVFNGTNLTATVPASAQSASGISISSDNGTNSIPSNAIVNITGNKVSGFKNSMAVYDQSALAPNTFVGYGNLPAGVIVNINNNSFTNDSISINNGTVSQQILANCNWYGSAALQNIRNKVSLQTVTYTPYLTTGTDNEPTTIGFQHLPGTCNNFPITATVDSYTNVTCNGANNGAINITVIGGAAPYVFAWTKDGDPLFISNVEDPANFGPGIYHLSITDALGTNILMDENGGMITIDVTIIEPQILTSAGSGSNVSCFNGTNGTASVLADGGTAPYTYLWSNGAITNTINNLSAGTYTVTVTDANGCTSNASYLVTQPSALSITVTGTLATCNGSVNANVSGGTTPYIYLWNNGATTQSISNVPAGTYSVVVTDANGCTVTGAYTITGNSSINPTATVTNVNCFGGSNGIITVTGAGGTAPRTYNINGSPFQSNNIFNNLPAGVYIIGAKDANGCSDFVTKIITQPVLLTVVLDSTRKTCFGINGGRIYITSNGGSGAKTYSWTGPNGYISTVQDPNNLVAGDYSVTVTDTKGCTTALNVTLASWPSISISEVITNVACKNEFTGAINVTVAGGTGSGFTFSWNGPGNTILPATEDIYGLRSGNYTLTLTDAGSGCSIQKTIVVTQPDSVVNMTVSNPPNITACGGTTTITATGFGGTAPYEYSLDGGTYQTANIFTAITAGSHTVSIRDANGCIKTITKTVTDNGADPYETNNTKNQSKLISVGTIINARIAIASDGADWFKFTTGGAGIYTLNLTHPSISHVFSLYSSVNNSPALTPVSTTATTKEYNLSSNTTYHIQITGALSFTCYTLMVSEGSITIMNRGTDEAIKETPDVLTITKIQTKVYPNPHQGAFNLQISSPEETKAMIQIMTADGKIIINRYVTLQKGNSNILYFEGIRKSVLFYRVITNNKTVTGKIIGPN